MTETVKWRDVNSSNIERVGWCNVGNTPCIVVAFKDGRSYLYVNASRQRAIAMARAASVGRYFARKVKGKYDYMRIT